MNETALRNEIAQDLRNSPADIVIYLEGKTDPAFFFALIGRAIPSDGLYQGVLVKGLKGEGSRRGSGSSAVIARVELASRMGLEGVFGIVDGDGLTLERLTFDFDAPHPGPLFYWKSYCIENLMAKTGWPAIWGDEPDWSRELASYGPYVSLNRVGRETRVILKDLGLEKYLNPVHGEPLKLPHDISQALAIGKARLLSFDVEQEYQRELSEFDVILNRSLDEAHALFNGKWLFRHLVPKLTARDPDHCHFDWLAHAISVGGLAEVREWWERVTGSPP